MLVTPKLVLVHELWPLSSSPPHTHVQSKTHFSVHSVHAWWISWRMGPWIFNNSANIKASNVYSFYSFLCNLMNEVVPVLPRERSSPAQTLALPAKAAFHTAAPVNASCYGENRRKVDVHFLFQVHFSFLTVCQWRKERYALANYSGIPGFLVAFRAKTLKKQNFS